MRNKKIFEQLNKEIDAMPIPNVLKYVQENSTINVSPHIENSITKNSGVSLSKILKTATAGVLVITLGLFAFLGNFGTTTYTTITLDINPSIELTLNSSDEIVEVLGVNTDADELLSDLNITGQKYYTALNTILEKARLEGYIDESNQSDDSNAILFSVSGNQETIMNQIRTQLNEQTQTFFQEKGLPCHILFNNNLAEIYDFTISEEEINVLAENNNISKAKMLCIMQLMRTVPSLEYTRTQLASMSMAELYVLLSQNNIYQDNENIASSNGNNIPTNNNSNALPTNNNPFTFSFQTMFA